MIGLVGAILTGSPRWDGFTVGHRLQGPIWQRWKAGHWPGPSGQKRRTPKTLVKNSQLADKKETTTQLLLNGSPNDIIWCSPRPPSKRGPPRPPWVSWWPSGSFRCVTSAARWLFYIRGRGRVGDWGGGRHCLRRPGVLGQVRVWGERIFERARWWGGESSQEWFPVVSFYVSMHIFSPTFCVCQALWFHAGSLFYCQLSMHLKKRHIICFFSFLPKHVCRL